MIEAITIYLAAGAPFGVSYYLRRERGRARTSDLLRGTWAALLWPVAAATVFLARRPQRADAADEEDAATLRVEEKIERAKRQLLAMLHKVEELARAVPGRGGRTGERVALVVCESIEKYVGLTLGSRDASADGPPTGTEMELCRVAGRTGEDLLIAGRCIHRRNVARLSAHRERARANLLHALAELRDLTADASSAPGEITAARHASVAILRLYAEAINLLSLLEDEDAARKVARLLDAECARLRRLEAASPGRSHEERPAGEEPCRPHTHRLAFTGPLPNSPLTRG
ncbi:MAG TPA: hypothetical protein VF553_11470 [Pyrinomonadaceae bacterium]